MCPLRLALVTALVLSASATAQPTWLNVSPLKSPPARWEHAMAYDANRGVVVLFGGRGTLDPLGDTWEWDGVFWKRKSPTTSPSARSGPVMAYDAKAKKVLLFGGYDNKNRLADTWSWDGITWKRLSPKKTPRGRSHHAMATDTNRSVIVMFGGRISSGIAGDTWEWNGTDWTEQKPTTPPPARIYHGMAYDPQRKLTVMYGNTNQSALGTWEWSGSAWTKKSPRMLPWVRFGVAMAHDTTRKRTVIFGGLGRTSQEPTNRVIEWDGSEWRAIAPRASPSARYFHTMVYDSRRRRMVAFGGVARNDTWELVHDCFCIGKGHAVGGLLITCLSPPVLDTNFRVAFSNGKGKNGLLFVGPANTGTVLKLKLPVTCSDASFYVQPIATLASAGSPSVLVAKVPNIAQLVGRRLTLQGASLQPTNCFLVTDAIEATFRY